MRKKIYQAICQCLAEKVPDVRYISLWNNNTSEFTSQSAFGMPAVFVEFEPIQWSQMQCRARSATARIRLHILTETLATPEAGSDYQDQALEHLDQIERISAAVQGLSGDGFNCFMLVESVTDHEHARIEHDEECFITGISDGSAMRRQPTVTGIKPVIKR